MSKSLAKKILSKPFRDECQRIFYKHNREAYGKRGRVVRTCSFKTTDEREKVILHAFAELHQLGFQSCGPQAASSLRFCFTKAHLRVL